MPSFMRLVVKGAGGQGAGASWHSHWLFSNTGDEADGDDLANALRGRIETHLIPVLSDAYSLARIDWTYWSGSGPEPFPTQVYTFTPLIGENTGTNTLPPRITMLIEYKALTTKPNRKRVYVGRFNEGQNETGGIPSGATIAGIQAYADNTLNSMSVNGHDWQFCVVRLQRYPLTGSPAFYTPWSYNAFSSHLVQTKWAFLRTRDVNRGI